ncbi:MAG: DNA polymerase III subunit delta [Acidobacteriota bacterium]
MDAVYLVAGAESYLRRQAVQAIIAAVTSESGDQGELAVERLDGSRIPMAEILDTARSLPLFLPVCDRPVRVVWVSDFDPTSVSEPRLLQAYLEAPVKATCLLLESTAVDARRAATKMLCKLATRIDCEPLQKEAEVRQWIGQAARARQLEITPEAVTYLVEMAGPDLQRFDHELEKAEIYLGQRRSIEGRDFEKLLGRSRQHSVFELTDGLTQGSVERSLVVLNQLLDEGEEPVRLLAMVSWIVRQLIIARDLFRKGCPEPELLQQLGGRWNQRREMLKRARRSRGQDLSMALVACAEADSAVKLRRGNPGRGVLEALCRQVCAA